MQKHTATKAISLCLAILLLGYATPALCGQKPVTIKIASLAPEGSSWITSFKELSTKITAKTENRVKFRIYPGGVLGDEKDILRKMHIGQVQGAALTSSGLSMIFPEMDVLQIPFLFMKYEEVDYVIEKMDAFFRKGFDDKGYVFLGWTEGGFVQLMSTMPVATLPELQKAKVWIWEDSPMAKAIFDEAQVSGIPLSAPDVLVGLQTGLVDVVYAPPSGAIALQWFTKVNYITDLPLIYLAGGIVIKKQLYKKISPADQKVMQDIFRESLPGFKRSIRKENEDALLVMQKHGVKLTNVSEDTIAEFKRVSNKAMDKMNGPSFSKKIRAEVTAHLETYREMNK